MPRAWKNLHQTRKVARVEPIDIAIDEAEAYPASGPRTGVRGYGVAAPDTSPQLPLADDFLAKVPVVAVPADWITMTRIDHRAGYLLSRIDGAIDVETVLDVSCMPFEETLALLEELIGLGLVTLR